MSRWVKQQYEGVLAFLFIVIAAFIPWQVSVASTGEFGRIIAIRWWIGEIMYIPAIEEFSGWEWIIPAIELQQGQHVFTGYILWGIGTAVFVIALALAVGLFFREEKLSEQFPVHYLAGGLLLVSGVLYLAASMWISSRGIPGTYVPIGALFNLLFGTILVTNRFRVEETREGARNTDESSNSTDPDPIEEQSVPESN